VLIKILVIDDDPLYAQLLGELLGDNYVITAKADLRSGMEAVNPAEIDCVLLDLSLPDSEGAAATLRRFFQGKRGVACLILTNTASDDMMARALELGALGYLVKSKINSDWLKSAIFQAIYIRGVRAMYRQKLEGLAQMILTIWQEATVASLREQERMSRQLASLRDMTDPGLTEEERLALMEKL